MENNTEVKYRFLVFGVFNYYPGGGMLDCILKTNHLEKVDEKIERELEKDDYNEYHIYDVMEGEYEVVREKERRW